MSRRAAGGLLLLALVLPSAAPPGAARGPREGTPWEARSRLESDHWRLETNLPREKGDDLLRKLEALRACFLRELALGAPARAAKLRVLAFRARDDYLRNIPLPDMKRHSGFFDPATNASYFSLDALGEPALFHEATHQLAWNHLPKGEAAGPRPNFWVVEGLAAWFESFSLGADGAGRIGDFETGRRENIFRFRLGRAKEMIADGEWEALPRYVLLDDDSYRDDGQGGRTRGWPRYSEGALLVHYLMTAEAGRHRAAFVEYLKDVYACRTRPDSFARRFGVAPAELEPRVLAFARALPIDLDKEDEEADREEERNDGREDGP